MFNFKYSFFFCLLLGILTSCGDKEEDPSPVVSQNDFLPLTVGSTWSYGGAATYTQKVLGTTKTINGKVYRETETKQGSTTTMGYVINEGGVYTTVSGDSRAPNLAFTVLKEKEPVNATWEQTDIINGVSTKSKFTIMAKGMTKTVEGKEYKEVTQVKLEQTYSVFGMEIPTAPNYYFYAKGVGLIQSDLGAQGSIVLKSYTIQ